MKFGPDHLSNVMALGAVFCLLVNLFAIVSSPSNGAIAAKTIRQNLARRLDKVLESGEELDTDPNSEDDVWGTGHLSGKTTRTTIDKMVDSAYAVEDDLGTLITGTKNMAGITVARHHLIRHILELCDQVHAATEELGQPGFLPSKAIKRIGPLMEALQASTGRSAAILGHNEDVARSTHSDYIFRCAVKPLARLFSAFSDALHERGIDPSKTTYKQATDQIVSEWERLGQQYVPFKKADLCRSAQAKEGDSLALQLADLY